MLSEKEIRRLKEIFQRELEVSAFGTVAHCGTLYATAILTEVLGDPQRPEFTELLDDMKKRWSYAQN